MTKISTDEEYEQIKSFFKTFTETFYSVEVSPADRRPFAVLERMERENGRPQARRSLVLGLNECLATASSLSREKIEEFDSLLQSLGLPTLTSVRIKYGKDWRQILKRGRIRNEGEFYLARGVVDDTEEGSTEERMQLLQMIAEFERM
jgi:hypothetical protein